MFQMANSLTGAIAEGTDHSLANYLLRCSKSFGYVSHMRDDASHSPLRMRESNVAFYQKRLKESKQELEKMKQTSLEEVSKEIQEIQDNFKRHQKELNQRKNEIKVRYEEMISKIKTWTPPSAAHEKLKNYAISQLEQNMKFDCHISKYEESESPVTPEEFKSNRIDFLQRQIIQYTSDIEEEKKFVNEANQWISQLKESLEKIQE